MRRSSGLERNRARLDSLEATEGTRMTYRDHLPQLDGDLFLTDGGIETVLIFHEGLDLPLFAAFDLLKDEAGRPRCGATTSPTPRWRASAALGLVLESPTWRASPRWAGEIGYGAR